MQLHVVTPLRPIVDVEVTEMVAPGVEGEFGVLPEHVTFLAGLKPGIIGYTEAGTKKHIVVSGGYAEVRQDAITILADDAQFPDEVDSARARADISTLQEELARGSEDPRVTVRLMRELELAEARVEIGARP